MYHLLGSSFRKTLGLFDSSLPAALVQSIPRGISDQMVSTTLLPSCSSERRAMSALSVAIVLLELPYQ